MRTQRTYLPGLVAGIYLEPFKPVLQRCVNFLQGELFIRAAVYSQFYQQWKRLRRLYSRRRVWQRLEADFSCWRKLQMHAEGRPNIGSWRLKWTGWDSSRKRIRKVVAFVTRGRCWTGRRWDGVRPQNSRRIEWVGKCWVSWRKIVRCVRMRLMTIIGLTS